MDTEESDLGGKDRHKDRRASLVVQWLKSVLARQGQF